MKRILNTLPLILICLFSLNTYAQTVKTNAEGDKIVVFPDGTWRYLEPGEIIPTPQEELDPLEAPIIDSTEQKIKLSTAEKEVEFKARIAAVKLAEQKSYAVEKAEKELTAKKQEKIKLQNNLAKIRSRNMPDTDKEELVERQIIKATEEENAAIQKVSDAQKEADFYKSLIYLSSTERTKAIDKYLSKNDKKSEKTSTPPSRTSTAQQSPGNFAKYNPAQDVMLNPPPYQCKIAVDETDEFTGKRRRTTKSELFFTHTREEIRPYFQDKEHTVCHGNITAMEGGIYVLSLEIAISSRTAQQEYGGILSNGTLLVVLMDGSTISMINNRTSKGKYDAVRDAYIFNGNYQIPPKQVDDLVKGEVDKVRVVWELGYDTYEIYEPDFLSNHLGCLVN